MIQASREQGFTLIEVLIALALMSLVGTILIESLRIAGHTWQHVTREASDLDEISRAQDFLRQHLQALYPPNANNGSSSSPELFSGQADRFEFVSIASGTSHGAIVRYSLQLTPKEVGDLEIRYRQERLPASGASTEWASEPLLTHVAKLSLQYWESRPESAGHWIDHWTDPAQLPKLIRIDIAFSRENSRHWPPLYVEPLIDTRASCTFDIVSRRCRPSA